VRLPTARPNGQRRPDTSMLDVESGDTRATSGLVRLGVRTLDTRTSGATPGVGEIHDVPQHLLGRSRSPETLAVYADAGGHVLLDRSGWFTN
jgi:hypothetical protein